jgi:prophage antirepressor-like protein
MRARAVAAAGPMGFPALSRKGVLTVSNGTAIEPFDFNGNPIRIVIIDGDPWFVNIDVCAPLGIERPADAVRRLDEDEYRQVDATTVSGRTPGFGPQAFTVVSESGLYSLVLGSRKPEAKAFKRWVTGEVLPQIRRTGMYATPASTSDGLDLLEQQAELHLASIKRMKQIERKVEEQAKAIEAHEEQQRRQAVEMGEQQLRLDRLEENHERVTAVGYANTRGLRSDVAYLNKLGRVASAVAKQWGIEVSRVHSTIWGEVNAWPVEVWDEALSRL